MKKTKWADGLLLGICLLLLSVPRAFAQQEQPSLKAGTEIRIESYDSQVKAFLVVMVREQAVGPNYVEPEVLKKAIEYQNSAKSMVSKKDRLIGTQYTLKNKLPLISDEQILKRQKKK